MPTWSVISNNSSWKYRVRLAASRDRIQYPNAILHHQQQHSSKRNCCWIALFHRVLEELDSWLLIKIFIFTNSHNVWYNDTQKTKLCLYIDDFIVQYFLKEDVTHPKEVLEDKYIVTTDFSGTYFCGLDLQWDYVSGWVDISMLIFFNYV